MRRRTQRSVIGAAGLWALGALGACATTRAPAEREVACGECGGASLPAWARPAGGEREVPRAEIVATEVPRVAAVQIVPEAPRDPVADVLRRRGGRRRLDALNLRASPVVDTLRMFATLGRFNLVFGDDVGARTITLDLHGVTVAQGFLAVVAAAHLETDVIAGDILEVHGPRAVAPTARE